MLGFLQRRACSARACRLLFVVLWAPTGMTTAQQAVPEVELKAAYLFNFAKFAEWPAGILTPASPLTICAVGKDGLGDSLQQLEAKTVQGRAVKVRRGVKAEDLKGCQLAFFPAAENRPGGEVWRAAEALSVLTIGDGDGFVEVGGMIGLVKRDNRITFDINADSAQRAGIRLSSQVLKLARSVKGKSS